MLRFKPEVRIEWFHPQRADVLMYCTVWSLRMGVDVEINSIQDGAGIHKTDSLHSYGLALDIDTVMLRLDDLVNLTDYLRRLLPTQYDVIFVTDHVHVEWDARRGPLARLVRKCKKPFTVWFAGSWCTS